MKKYNTSNQELGLFFGINFGLTILMGIAIGFAFDKASLGSFALVQMYYPAMSVMIIQLLKRKGDKDLPRKFLITFLFFAITSIIYLLISIFILNKNPDIFLEIWLIIGSIAIIIAYYQESDKSIESYGLKLKKNKKLSIINILL